MQSCLNPMVCDIGVHASMLKHTHSLSGFFNESAALLRLSLPIIVTQLATQGMNFVDTSMAGQVSATDLAAIAVGASLWYPISLLLRGVLMALTPLTAHHRGSGQQQQINHELGQGLWLAMAGSLLAILFLQQSEGIMAYMQVAPEVAPIATQYLQALAFGVPGIALFYSLNSFCEGMGNTRAPMLFSLLGLAVNIPANYLLINGKFGLPALGAVGCGWATSIVYWLMSLMMGLYIARHHEYRQFLSRSVLQFKASQAWAQFKLGLPIGMNIFICGSIFAIIALLIGKLGANNIASHQIALNFSGLMYMVPLSLSFGITIRVGHALGQGNAALAKLRSYSGIALTLAFSCISSASIVLFREQIARIYTQDPLVAAGAASLIIFAACYQLSDAIQTATNGVLRGYKDTKLPMFISGMAYWGLALPVGYTLGLTDKVVDAMGAAGFWVGIIVGLTAAAIMMSLRLRAMLSKQQAQPLQAELGFA
ncbi:MATE family efflux transporter [Aliagarivorans marinus]|uniref:MATE family efflux transporter n=1 Tax=Aliagarivorans marinus TaxID=561965 RepID=UPI001B7FE594|nr:MATE family efflux transporter [Aliagarivorans marinus]